MPNVSTGPWVDLRTELALLCVDVATAIPQDGADWQDWASWVSGRVQELVGMGVGAAQAAAQARAEAEAQAATLPPTNDAAAARGLSDYFAGVSPLVIAGGAALALWLASR